MKVKEESEKVGLKLNIQVIPEWCSGFLHFLQFQSEFGNKEN